MLGAGQGASEIPYDQSAQEVPMPVPRQPQEEEMPNAPVEGGTEESSLPVSPEAGLDQGQAAGGAGDILAGLGGGQMDTSALSEDDLAGMVDEDPAQSEADQLMMALEDPNTPPEMKQMIQMQLATAAKRRMAGMMGGGA